MSNRHHKQRRTQRIEWMIRQEAAKAERILDENLQGASVLTKQLDNEPKGLAKAFAEIEAKGGRN